MEVEIDELFGRIEPNSPCLVGDAFWRFVQGGMPPAEVVAIERHLVVCESCTGAVAAAASELSPPLSRISGAQSSGTTGSSFPLFVPFSEALARYAVKGILGVGGMGVVYEGLDRETGRRVAIKTVRAASLDALSALRQEIGILRRMKHPGVVAVLDDGVAGSDPWYAMELLEGETLAARNDSLWQRDSGAEAVTLPGDGASPSVARPGASAEDRAAGGRLPEVLGLYARLCEPLAFVHAAGIVHGDLKPGNVFIRAEEQPVLMDFGLSSRASGRLGRETMDVGGRFRGTLAYVAPEQIVGGFADARADLYALGCMLYESVTGRPPFEATTPARIKEMHLKEAPLPASARVEGIPAALDQLIQRLLAKDPVDRVVSADDVGGALRGLLPAQAGRARAPDTLVDLPDAKPAAPVYLFRPRIIARDRILRELGDAQSKAQAGAGSLILLAGESGIGKTFLASEIAQRASRAGVEVIVCECQAPLGNPSGSNTAEAPPLQPLRPLLQRLADLCRISVPVRTRVGQMPQTFSILATYEPAFRPFAQASRFATPTTLPPEAARARLIEALHTAFSALAEFATTLVVIDDLQWADDLTAAVVDSLSSSFLGDKPLLVVATYRREEATPALAKIAAHARTLALGRLDPNEIGALVEGLLAGAAPPVFVDALARHSEGNPFFVAEYVRAALAEGALSSSGARTSGAGATALALPRSLGELLRRRLDQLSAEARTGVEVASVLGRNFSSEILRSLSPESDPRQVTDELTGKQVTESTSAGEFRFVHHKIRDVAYEGIPPERRVRLHSAVARALAQHHAGTSLEDHFASLAHHHRLAGEVVPAVDYLEKAAARALRDSANEDAIKLLMEARELAAQLPEALRPNLRLARWERQLGEAYQGIGNLAASRAHLLAALDRLERPLPLAGRKLANQLTKEAARQFVHRVRTRPPGEEQALQREIADALYAIGYVLYYEGKYEPLLCSTVAAVNLYEGLPPTPALALTYVNIAATFALIPVRWGVNKYFGLAAATLAQVPDAAAESHYELLRSSYALGIGDYEGAGRAAERAAALAESAGYRKRWEEAIGVRSGIALTRGDFVETDRWCEAYLSSALARKDAQIATIGYLNRAQRRVWRQELEPAEHELALAEAGIATAGKLEQIWARALRSSIALARGQSDAAEALAKEAADLLQATQPSHVFGLDAYARIAEVRLALLGSAATPAARKTRKAAAKASLRMLAVATKKFPIAQPSQLCHLGTSQWLDHEPRKAAATWRTGRTVAQHLQMPHWELRLLDALADAGAASSEEMRDRDLLRARLGLPALRLPGAAN